MRAIVVRVCGIGADSVRVCEVRDRECVYACVCECFLCVLPSMCLSVYLCVYLSIH